MRRPFASLPVFASRVRDRGTAVACAVLLTLVLCLPMTQVWAESPSGAVFAIWSDRETGEAAPARPADMPIPKAPPTLPKNTLPVSDDGKLDLDSPTCKVYIKSLPKGKETRIAVFYGFLGKETVRIGSAPVESDRLYVFWCSEAEAAKAGFQVRPDDFASNGPIQLASLELIQVAQLQSPCLIKVRGKWFTNPLCTYK